LIYMLWLAPDPPTVALFDLTISDRTYGIDAAPTGEIDLSTVDELGKRLSESLNGGANVLSLDLRGVSFLDSSGLRLVLRLNQEMRNSGRRLVLIQGPRRVAKVFELSGVEGELEIVADPEAIS
jgi:anti-anti-sigma factor